MEGSGNVEPFANTTNFDDFTFATTAGLYLRAENGAAMANEMRESVEGFKLPEKR